MLMPLFLRWETEAQKHDFLKLIHPRPPVLARLLLRSSPITYTFNSVDSTHREGGEDVIQTVWEVLSIFTPGLSAPCVRGETPTAAHPVFLNSCENMAEVREGDSFSPHTAGGFPVFNHLAPKCKPIHVLTSGSQETQLQTSNP